MDLPVFWDLVEVSVCVRFLVRAVYHWWNGQDERKSYQNYKTS